MNFTVRGATGLARNVVLAIATTFMVIACGGGYSGSGGGGGGYGNPPPPPPSAYVLSPLVSDGYTAAASTDAHLRNPWGLAALPTGPIWVANNADHSATVYDGTGLVQSLVVNAAVTGSIGDITGIIASTSATDFMVSNGTTSAAARFVFATEGGTLLAWAPSVNATNAIMVYSDGAGGAEYTGLATASPISGTLLYAADFHNGKIDVFDNTFAKLDATSKFVDATLPAGYAPFNIQAVHLQGATVLAVAYAKRDAVSGDEVAGAGLGVVDIFSTNGALLSRLIPAGGQLNAPWGLAVAPADFGTLGGMLLVGNFGDGHINGFDATSGAFVHAVSNSGGTPIAVSGLWGIAFGNGVRNQPANVLYIAAGSNDEADGLYARIDLGATAPDIVAPTAVAVTAPAAADSVSGTINVTANASDNVGVARVVFSVKSGTTTTDIATDTTAPFGVSWNTGTVVNGAATLTATAYDAYGNSTTSAGVAVTVANVPDVTPPTVSISAPAAGDVSGTVTVSATAADNIGVTQVEFFAGATSIGTDASAPYSVQWNTTGLNGAQQLTAVARDAAGNTTTSTAVQVNVIVNSVLTLAQLQASIFTPRCSACHNGSGGGLPGSMNLTSAAATYSALVNVTSQEESPLKRVLPGDASNSYIVRKLEGTNTVGARMPFGGPYLDQATIDQVRQWIQAGAAP